MIDGMTKFAILKKLEVILGNTWLKAYMTYEHKYCDIWHDQICTFEKIGSDSVNTWQKYMTYEHKYCD